MSLGSGENTSSAEHYIQALAENLEKNGFCPQFFLESANIATEKLQSGQTITTENLNDLTRLVCHVLHDETLGFGSQPVKPGTFYMMSRLSLHEATLGKALKIGMRFYRHLVNAYTLSLSTTGTTTTLSLELTNPTLDRMHFLSELILLSWHRYSSWLIDQNIPLMQTTFSYPPPKHVGEYKFLFPSQHIFNANTTSISFESHYLDQDVVQDTESLEGFINSCPIELFLKHRGGTPSLSQQVYQYLKKHINKGLPDIEEVSSALKLTRQTLRRRLKHEGSSFQQIKGIVRRDSALHYLTQKNTPICEVALNIGFSEPSVFVRAFKNWTGMTPSEYRNALK